MGYVSPLGICVSPENLTVVITGNTNTVTGFLKYFPAWDLEQPQGNVGCQYLGITCYQGNIETARVLLEAGANPLCQAGSGLTPLHHCSYNREAGRELMQLLLKIPQLTERLDMPVAATMKQWKKLHRASRLLVRFGSKSKILKHLAQVSGSTPLHIAAHEGNIEAISVLLAEGAQPRLKNKQGLTAAKAIRVLYGSVPGPLPASNKHTQ